jgi:Tol biopolymer transport system component
MGWWMGCRGKNKRGLFMRTFKILALLVAVMFVPAYAADSRQKLAFISDRAEEIGQVYVLNMDSKELKRITDKKETVFYRISVSPDGNKILAAAGPLTNADRVMEKDDLYIMDASGENLRKITDNKFIKDGPGWFPSSRRIIYASNESGYFGICTAGVDGKDVKKLTGGKFNDLNPAVSPDGKKIVFESDKAELNTPQDTESGGNDEEEFDEYSVPDGRRVPYNNDGLAKIYIMDANGKNRKRLTNQEGSHTRPFWSPDGKKLFYFSGYIRDSLTRQSSISYMDADGKNKETWMGLPDNTPDSSAVWVNGGESMIFPIKYYDNGSGRSLYVLNRFFKPVSLMEYSDESNFDPCVISVSADKTVRWNKPDRGLQGLIAYASGRDGGRNIYIAGADGSNQRKITDSNAAQEPSLSKDRAKIAYADYGTGADGQTDQIYVMNSDGTDKRQITDGPMVKLQPKWSPDCRKIVFIRFSAGNNNDICVINADGTGLAALTENKYHNESPSWSPDGKKIVFQSTRGGRTSLFIMDADGRNEMQLTKNSEKTKDETPCWSPDGKSILFSRNGMFWTISADGTDEKQMYCKQSGTQAVWSPDGKNIAFKPFSRNKGVFIMDADCANAVDMDDKSPATIYDIDNPSWQ